MWFNNLQLFRLTQPFTLSGEALEEPLAAHAFQPCGALQPSSFGWVSPLGREGQMLTHTVNGYTMVCARKEEKIIPASVIKEIVNEKAAAIEAEQGRAVRRKERQEMHDEVVFELMPKAFSRSSHTYAYIAPKENLIVVNAASAKKAEELVSELRKALGSLPAVHPTLMQAPASIMTQWLASSNHPDDVVIQDECELREPTEEGGIIRCKRQDLMSEEIQVHLNAGKEVVKLAIEWNEQLTCIIGDDLSIKRLRFSDELLEQSDNRGADDAAMAFDNDFSIMTLELARFIPRLLELFGGEDKSHYAEKI
ncbi:MAG: recombination-associated protein RdgC [Gammaproteobacteria bacterium]|nr:recombination-associated protein RdgC [Gammaproteobacteria bacterium]MCF6231472.1 recombination-associated protein RdgC [Gammaproteobacteria bacterium]